MNPAGGRLSIFLPLAPATQDRLLPFGRLAVQLGVRRIWQGQGDAGCPYQTFAALAACGVRLPFGVGVSVLPLQHPFDLAMRARNLALSTGRKVTVGIGTGAVRLQEAMLGRPYRDPLAAAGEYVTIVRHLLDGDRCSVQGSYFTCTAGLPPAGPADTEIALGVLRPGMARLAGAVADAAITWMAPPRYLADTLIPALRASAERAGRKAPRTVAVVPVACAAAGRTAEQILLAGNGAHLRQPHYRAMLREARLSAPTPAAFITAGGMAYGSPADVRAALDEYFEAGADEVVLDTTGVRRAYGLAAAAEDIAAVLGDR